MTVDEYLSGPEELRRRELVWGMVREPPSPFAPHQRVTTRIAALLDAHVREHDLGTVLVSPMDVVLDKRKALVVQPDAMFISHARAGIIRDLVWGAPDLVIEVASRGTARYDRRTKIGWYRTYGVLECWLLDPGPCTVTIANLQAGTHRSADTFVAEQRIRSAVLPRFNHTAAEVLA